MPCRTDDYYYDDSTRISAFELREYKIAKATLCMLFTHYGIHTLINEQITPAELKEAGVKKGEIFGWWNRHEKEDRARRERERVLSMKSARRPKLLLPNLHRKNVLCWALKASNLR